MSKKGSNDFQYPAEFGFSGSAGKTAVRGYTRAAPTKKDQPAPLVDATTKTPAQKRR